MRQDVFFVEGQGEIHDFDFEHDLLVANLGLGCFGGVICLYGTWLGALICVCFSGLFGGWVRLMFELLPQGARYIFQLFRAPWWVHPVEGGSRGSGKRRLL